jgi:hypothetical protein
MNKGLDEVVIEFDVIILVILFCFVTTEFM